MNEEVITKGFEISPSTVYGFLIGVLILAVIALAIVAVTQYKANQSHQKKYQDLLSQNITVIETFSSLFTGDGAALRKKEQEDLLRKIVKEESDMILKAFKAMQSDSR